MKPEDFVDGGLQELDFGGLQVFIERVRIRVWTGHFRNQASLLKKVRSTG